MKIITNTTDFYLEKETAVAIGKFDGIHVGHRSLLEEILKCKQQGLEACVFTFNPAPSVLFGQSDGRELSTPEEKRLLFERIGVDILIEFPLTFTTAAIQPEIFAEQILAKQMRARMIAAGQDLSFGAKGAGDAELLKRLAPQLGFQVKTIDKVCVDGVEVSSTYIRSQVETGNMFLVNRLMGMPYMVMGKVVPGKQLGRTIGFPTVNVLPGAEKLLPPKGVYYSQVRHGDKIYRAISNVGCKPTVTDEHIMGVESFLYDFDEDIYGENVEIYLYEFRRPERQFESVEALQNQLKQDIADGAMKIY